MRKLINFIAFPFMERPTVTLTSVNATRKSRAQGRREYNGRFVKPYRVS